jgi:hypothetical protein
MENRPKFVEQALAALDEWMTAPDVLKRIPNERVRLVYGSGYAAFIVLSKLIAGDGAEERAVMLKPFRDFLFTHGEQALQDVISETYLSRFWTVVISGLQRNKIKKHFFELRYVTREPDGRLKTAQAADKGAIRVCYMAPNPVFDEYSQDLRTRNETVPLDLGDLRRQLSKESYWLPPPKSDHVRVHRATIQGTKSTCWVISLEQDSKGVPLFPFAEDLEELLDPSKMSDDDEPPPPSDPVTV